MLKKGGAQQLDVIGRVGRYSAGWLTCCVEWIYCVTRQGLYGEGPRYSYSRVVHLGLIPKSFRIRSPTLAYRAQRYVRGGLVHEAAIDVACLVCKAVVRKD